MTITTKQEPDSPEAINHILHPLVLQWFRSTFPDYSLPQRYGVMEIQSRRNILLSAPTGATKTLTAFLAILNELVDSALKGILEDKIYAVYISPLKALNYDIAVNLERPLREICELAGKDLGIRIGVRTGDTSPRERQKMSKTPPHILVTTPESLAIALNVPSLDRHIRDVQWCIVDEIHALAENKRGVHLSLSLERLQRRSPGLTRIGLSATVAPLDEVARFLVGNRECTIIDIKFLKELDLQVISPVPDLIETTHGELQDATYKAINELVQAHTTTAIFTNTRAATERVVHQLKSRFPTEYYEMGENPPHTVSSLIGAHHGSLSKDHRFSIEEKLRNGELRCVVSSTSLELGIDIGHIDLVILLTSPKSTARLLQRVGRSGHQLHATTKGRLIVQDRDDLLECSIMLKEALDGHIDRLHIPTNAMDVLTQHLLGMALEDTWTDAAAFELVRQSYCFRDLSWDDFLAIIHYLSGEFIELEQRHIYAKIWHENGQFGKKGRMTRVIYLTNIGTIADQGGIAVKQGPYQIGTIDEAFLESLKPGDIFVLGGETYQFRHARGMVANVVAAHGRRPTVPAWYSEMLPLSYDVGVAITRFRNALASLLDDGKKKSEALAWIRSELYVDDRAALAIYNYCAAQRSYTQIPSATTMLIEHYTEEHKHYAFFLLALGKRTNEALARLIGFAAGRLGKANVEIAVTDHGFYLAANRELPIDRAIEMLKGQDTHRVLSQAMESSEMLKRRFRQCAMRALMILRQYKGRTKRVGVQQMSSSFLLRAVRQVDPDFIILREARREVMEDYMDIDHASVFLASSFSLKHYDVVIPSPFASGIYARNVTDVLTANDRQEFLRNLHRMVLAKIALEKGKKREDVIDLEMPQSVSYEQLWETHAKHRREEKRIEALSLKDDFVRCANAVRIPSDIVFDITQRIEHPSHPLSRRTQEWVDGLLAGTVPKIWNDRVVEFLRTLT